MYLYTIYRNPSDYPGKFVVRRFWLETPDPEPLAVVDTLEEAREAVPPEADHNIGREPGDEPQIVETWI